MSKEEKKNLSYGHIISQTTLKNTAIFPDIVKDNIKETNDYLCIFFPGFDHAKLNIFPVTSQVNKLLVKLQRFSPQLVKGISEILRNLKLEEKLIHTTGLCFSNDECYYESYLSKIEDFSADEIKSKIKKIENVIDVSLIDVEKIL